jgi:hypothetical protein
MMTEPRGPEGDVGRWLALLRDGSEEEQQRARTELGLILEARGLLEDAAEAYERNVAAGVSDPRPYERLAALARARGDRATAARVLRALADVLAPTPTLPDSPVSSAAPESPAPPAASHEDAAAPAEPESSATGDMADLASESPDPTISPDSPATTEADARPDPPMPPAAAVLSPVEADAPVVAEDAPTVVAAAAPHEALASDLTTPDDTPATPRAAADVAAPTDDAPAPESGAAPEPDAKPKPERRARLRSRQAEDDDPGVALHHVLEMHPEETRHHVPPQRPPRPTGPGMSRTLVTLALLVPVLVVIVGAALAWPIIPNARPTAPPTGPLLATVAQSPPPTVEMRLIAGTVAPLPSPAATQVPTPAVTVTATPAPLAARCADAGLRFPETRDAEAAVRAAYRDYLTRQGVPTDAPSREFVGLGEAYAARHDEVVAGWMAVTLQREQRGLASFPLADYVASDVVVAVGPGEYQLRATVSPQGWSEIRSWPAETCEGAFMRSPANAHWVDLMQTSVGDVTWALPTRQPSR